MEPADRPPGLLWRFPCQGCDFIPAGCTLQPRLSNPGNGRPFEPDQADDCPEGIAGRTCGTLATSEPGGSAAIYL